MRSSLGWIITLCFLGALIGGFFLLKDATSGELFTLSSSDGLGITLATTTLPEAIGQSPAAPPLPEREPPDGYKEYRNEDFGFSLFYPASIEPKEFVDRGPELTVLFQSAEGEPGFEVYVAPISEDKITPERFARDAPSGVVQEPRNIYVDGAQAVTFYGFDAKVGKTSEVWTIKNTLLYEVSTYKELGSWLQEMMTTWRFATPKISL